MVLSASITRDSSPPDATRASGARLVTDVQRDAELHVLRAVRADLRAAGAARP